MAALKIELPTIIMIFSFYYLSSASLFYPIFYFLPISAYLQLDKLTFPLPLLLPTKITQNDPVNNYTVVA